MSDEQWVLDLNGIKAKERAALDAAMKSGDDEQVYPFMAKVIKVWPYALNPSDPASYGELGMEDSFEAAHRFALAIFRYLKALQTFADGLETTGEGRGAGAPEGAVEP